MLDWHVAVYAVNEAERLAACLHSILAALAGSSFRISLVLNGTSDGSEPIAGAIALAGAPIDIYRIAHADKSNAINHFYYELRRPARLYAEVDGHVKIAKVALQVMGDRLARDAAALTVSGIAINGRTMPKWDAERAKGGRLMGGLHALRPALLDRMVARGIRLPIGLYRGDGLIGSMAAHDLDPRHIPWDNARVAGEREAHVEVHQLNPLRPVHLRRQFRRKISQMRGMIENAAIAEIIYRDGFEGLPRFADDMIATYLARHAPPMVSWPDRVFQRMAIARSRAAIRPGEAALVARKV